MAPIEFLPNDFGYVILCIFYLIVVDIYMGMEVGKARKIYNVELPALYSDKSDLFNCIQRVHQNTVEQLAVFFSVIIVVGMAYPRYAAVCGAIYVTSRLSYAWGYYTGDPKKRMNGNYGYFGHLGLLLGLLYIGVRQMGCCEALLPF